MKSSMRFVKLMLLAVAIATYPIAETYSVHREVLTWVFTLFIWLCLAYCWKQASIIQRSK